MKPFSWLRITLKVTLSICAVVFVVLTFAKTQAFAADGIFKQINFQGKLTNLNGTNVADGNYSVVFTLYDAASAGTNLWTETQSVTVADGIFRVLLGSSTSLSTVNFNKDTIYLGIKVGSDTEMTPRVRFTAVPYAFNAEKVNGLTVANVSGNPFASTTTLRIGDGKTVQISNGLTFAGTDSTSFTFPSTGGNIVTEDFTQTLTNKTIGSTGLTFSGATTDITTGTNEDFVLSPNGTGKMGFNTTSPLATFDLRYKSGTLAIASISGTTSFATLALDNYGSGDLFVASNAGFPRFVIRSNGNVGINKAVPTEALEVGGNITVAGGSVYKVGGVSGVSGSNACLTTTGGIVTTIAGTCAGGSGGGSNWGEAGGIIYPGNVTETLSIGGAATSSAKFLVYAMDSGSGGNAITAGSASTAGALSFFGSSPILNFLNGGNLNIQSSVGGDSGTTSRLFISGNTGNIGFGTITPSAARLHIVGTGTNTSLRLANGVQTADFTTNQIGNFLLTPSGGNATVSGSLQVTSYATVAASLGIGNVTAPLGNGILNLSGNYQIRGVDGVSGSNSCLTTIGGIVTTIAGSCGGAGGSATWTIANGAIFPNQASVLDLLIGGTATSAAKFSITGIQTNGVITPVIASIAGNLVIMPDYTRTGSLDSGKVSIGTTSAQERLNVAGNIRIESKPVSNVNSTTWTRINNAPGTINPGGTTGIASISASTIFNGSLYVGTSKLGSAEVYRYTGSNTWMRVNTAAGQLASVTGIDSITAMTVHNGQLYVGTSKLNAAEVYKYVSGTSWVQVSGVAGTIGSGQASTDAVTSLISYQGRLYAGTFEVNTADILVYTGGASFNSWNRVNSAVGNICGDTLVDEINGLTIYNGSLIASYRPDVTNNVGRSRVCRITGGAIATSTLNSALGTYNLSQGNITSIASISAMLPYNGRLMLGVRKTNQADVIGLDNQIVIAAGAGFERTNSAAGTITQGGTANIDGVSAMAVYENQLYAGTEEMGAAGAGGAEVYKYAGNDRWIKITQAAGTIAASGTTGISTIDKLIVWNNKLYAMTNRGRLGGAEIYEYNGAELEQSSYSLLFHSAVSGQSGGEMGGFENLGEIYFNATSSAGLNNQGAFVFSHSIVSAGGGFDVAEDYPTHDTDLSPGDVVAMSDSEAGFVERAKGTYNERTIGVYSEKPGFRLSQGKGGEVDGNPAIAVALVGRVPVKVSTENGVIKIGDPLTSSSVPGVGMKATKAGAIIGNAMEPYNQEGVGKITAYITKGTQQGTRLADLLSGLSVTSTPQHTVLGDEIFGKQLLSVFLAQKAQNLEQTTLSEIYTDRVAAGLEIITPRITTHEVSLDVIKPATASGILVALGENGTFSIVGQDGKNAVSFDSQGNAFFSGTLRADKIIANQIEGLEIITTGIKSQEARIADLESLFASSPAVTEGERTVLSASDSAQVILSEAKPGTRRYLAKDLLDASSAQHDNVLTLTSLQVDGLATVSGNLRTKGSGLFEGMLSVVDTLTTQNLIVSGISTFFDEVIFKKHVTFEETPVFSTDTAGVVAIEKGNKKGGVRFSKPYEETPIIQVSRTAVELSDDEYKEYLKNGFCADNDSRDDCQEKADLSLLRQEIPYIVSKKSKEGFSILLQRETSARLQFSWTALTITKERR